MDPTDSKRNTSDFTSDVIQIDLPFTNTPGALTHELSDSCELL